MHLNLQVHQQWPWCWRSTSLFFLTDTICLSALIKPSNSNKYQKSWHFVPYSIESSAWKMLPFNHSLIFALWYLALNKHPWYFIRVWFSLWGGWFFSLPKIILIEYFTCFYNVIKNELISYIIFVLFYIYQSWLQSMKDSSQTKMVFRRKATLLPSLRTCHSRNRLTSLAAKSTTLLLVRRRYS